MGLLFVFFKILKIKIMTIPGISFTSAQSFFALRIDVKRHTDKLRLERLNSTSAFETMMA